MTRFASAALSLIGLTLFLAVWQGLVVSTRPAPVRRVTLGFSVPRADAVCAALMGAGGETLMREPLSLATAAVETEIARLRTWIGAFQPTLVGIPAPGDVAKLRALLERARNEFGGGLEEVSVREIGASDPCQEAVQAATRTQRHHITRVSWLPGPAEAFGALRDMAASGELGRHVVASVFRVAAGVSIALMLGIPLGLAIGSFAWLNALANGVIQLLRPISPIAWLPVATLALGGGDVAAVFLIFLAAFFPVTVSTAAATAAVDLKYRRSAMNFGVRGIQLAWQVILPATLPAVLTAIRISVGIAWVVVVAAEMLGVESGLGYLVLDARNQLRYDRVVAAMLVIGSIGLLIDAALRAVERVEIERRGLARR